VINNSVNNLKSGSIEWSANNSNWETDWNLSAIGALTSSGVTSVQISENSRKYLRVRAFPSGAAGAISGSIDVYIHTNNG